MTEELKQVGNEAETGANTEAMQGAVAPVIEGSAGSDFMMGQATRLIDPPAAGQTDVIKLAPGERLELAANPATVNLVVDGNNLVLGFDLDGDGVPDSFVVLEDLVLAAGSGNPPVLMVAGEPIGVDLLIGNALALSGAQSGGPGTTLDTAAGPDAVGGGATNYSDNLGDAIDLLVAQGVIPPVALEFGLIELDDRIDIIEDDNEPPLADPVLTPASQPDGGEGGGLPADLLDALEVLSSAVPADQLDAFLGLPAGFLTAELGATEGSATKFSFSAEAGDVISFDWNFLTNEVTPELQYNDSSFFILGQSGVGINGDLLANTEFGAFLLGNSTFNEQTGYYTFNFVIPADGDYFLGFGVVDVDDDSVSSGLLIDNFQINGSTTGFESGSLAGWEVIGDAEVVTAAFGVTPTEGSFQGLITTDNGIDPDSIVFYKQLVVDGAIGDDDSGIIADFGGADSETSLENLVFTLLSNPTFGQLILVTAGGDTSFLTPGDTFSSEDTVWWIATNDQAASFLAQPGSPEFLPNVNFNYSVTDEAGGVATAPVVITLPPPTVPRTALGIFQDDCLNEDTEGKLLFSAYPTDGASKISQVVISGFPVGEVADAWVVDETSVDIFGYALGIDYTTSYNALTGELTINFITASFSLGESVQGTVDVTPNPDSDVDHALTIEATAINGAGTATDTESTVIPVDADADGAEGSPSDDGDGIHLSISASVADSDDEGGSFQPDEVGTLSIHATFDDFLDGSETHTIAAFAPDGFSILTIDPASLPSGVTLVSNDGLIAVFDIDTTDGVGVIDLELPIQNVGAEEGAADFLVRAIAEETSTGDVECADGGEGGIYPVAGDNVAFVEANAPASVAEVLEPEVSLNLYGGDDCIEEDSTNNQMNLTVDPDGDDLLTEIVITGLQPDWTYDFGGLGGAGITVDASVPGQVTITFDAPSNATYNGSFLVTPPEDSDVDHPTIGVAASVQDPVDPGLTADGSDTLEIHVDANADSVGVDLSVNDSGDVGDSFQSGETGSVTVNATFGDFLDGSELHTVTVNMPAGFSYDPSTVTGVPAGTTIDDSDPSKIVFTVPTDALNGTGSFSATFEVTNDSAGDGDHVFSAEARTVEQNANSDPDLGDVECDASEADNVAVASTEKSVTVTGITAPTVSINLEGEVTYIKEDSLNNVVEFAAATGDASDELATVVINFPLEVGAGDIDFSAVAAHADVSSVDIDDNGGAGPVVVTITFDAGVTSFSGAFTLDAPEEDSDVDLGDIAIVANVQDQLDNTLTDSANASLQIDVDAVLDAALDPGADSNVVESEIAGPQTLNLGLVAVLGSAGFVNDPPLEGDSGSGGTDSDGSESITVVLVLDNALPAGVTLSSTGGTVTQDLATDPTGKTYVITGGDLEAAINGLQVELPGSFEGSITGTVTATSKEANTPAGEVAASGAEPDTTDNVVVLSVDFSVTVEDGADPTGSQLNLTVDEAALDLVQDGDDLAVGTTFGNNAGSTAETTSGGLTFNAGADPIVDITFGDSTGIVVEDEAGNPISVVWSGSGTDTLTGTLNGVVVIVLSLTGDNTAVAGGTANVTVAATLTDAFPHDLGNTGDVAITGIEVDAEDDDGDIGTSIINVTVLDDEPNDISPEAATLGNKTGSAFTGDLDFYDNVGADKSGNVVFDPGLHDDILLEDDGVTPVTSNGDAIVLNVSEDGHTLTGYVESGANAGYQEGEDSKVFIVVLNPDAVNEGSDSYTMTIFADIDTGGGLLFDNFGDVSAGGPKDFIALDDPRTGAEDLGEDILITASPESGKVNASTQGVGVANQQVDAGETIRVDFVSNVVGLTDAIPGIKADFPTLTYGGHRTVNDSGFAISQDFGPTTVTVKAIDADDDIDFGGDLDDLQRNITLVTVISATGVILLDHVAANASNGGVSVVFNGNGTVTVSGLLEDYQVLVSSDGGGFDALEITAVGSKFDLGGIVTSSSQSGEPIDLDFGVVASDEDGDTSSGTIQVSVLPQIEGGAAAENLVAGGNGGDIQAGAGNDTLVGGIANDLLQGEDGADVISDGAGNDIIIGGDGADIINLANDGDTDILVYDSLSEAGDVVTGFSTAAPSLGGAGGDTIDLVDLLDSGSFTGTTLAEAQAGGYVQLFQNGGNVEVRVDLDGGANNFATVVTINSVTVGDLSDNIVVD